MRTLRHALILARKDLRIERRTRRVLSVVGVTGLLVVTVLALGLGPQRQVAGAGAVAILWMGYLFGGVLCFERTMAIERRDQALAGVLLTPVDKGAIFLGKLATNLVLVGVMAGVITPVGVVLFGFDLSAAPLGFVMIVSLSLLGVAALGTLFSAIVSGTRSDGAGSGGLLAMVVLPLSLPLVLVSTQLLLSLFESGRTPVRAVPLLVSFDVLFVAAGWLGFALVGE